LKWTIVNTKDFPLISAVTCLQEKIIKSVKKTPQRNCFNIYGNLQCFHFTTLELSFEGKLAKRIYIFFFFFAFFRHLSYSSDPQDRLYIQNLSSGVNFYPYRSKIIPTLEEKFYKNISLQEHCYGVKYIPPRVKPFAVNYVAVTNGLQSAGFPISVITV